MLLEAGKSSGLAVLTERDSDGVMTRLNNVDERYTVLRKIEFNSDRKMMTVIVKNNKTDKIYAFTKGADIAILPKIKD